MDSQNSNVDRKKIMQVLLPAGAVAAVVLLIGILVAMGDGTTATTTKAKDTGSPPFPLDAAEWKPLDGGLKIWDVKEGSGEPCPPGASVTIHYTGWLTSGKVFDSSRPELAPRAVDGNPVTFDLDRLIPAWKQGIPGMKPGGVRRLYVPYSLGYGETGSPPDIPPRADLLFEVELISHQ